MDAHIFNSNGIDADEIALLRSRFRRDPSVSRLLRHILRIHSDIHPADLHCILADVFRLRMSQTAIVATWWWREESSPPPIRDEKLDEGLREDIEVARARWDSTFKSDQ
jgi:hypothetical protein